MSETIQTLPSGPSFEIRIRRVLWILLGGMLVVAASGVMSAWALADAERDVETVEQATDALAHVLEGMVDQETGVRGFILTGREPFLETYGPGGATADGSLDSLEQLAAELPPLDLEGLGGAIRAWRDLADEEIGLVRSDRRDDAIAIVESGVPKQRFDLIRSRVSHLDEQLREVVGIRNERQADLERLLAVIGIAVVIAGLAVITMTLRWLRRSVTGPLAELTSAVEAPDERSFSALTGDAAGEVAAIARSADLLRRSKDIERRDAVVLAEQAERSRVAADLHDGPVQTLFAVQLQLQGVRGRIRDDGIRDVLGRAIDDLESTQTDVRSLMFDLSPPGLGDRPFSELLASVIPELAAQQLQTEVHVPADLSMARSSEVVVFRTIVEAVRNVSRHAGASRLSVTATPASGGVTFEVADDGCGFDTGAAAEAGHFGLGIMRSLVGSLDGTFDVRSAPGRGTTVRFTIST